MNDAELDDMVVVYVVTVATENVDFVGNNAGDKLSSYLDNVVVKFRGTNVEKKVVGDVR